MKMKHLNRTDTKRMKSVYLSQTIGGEMHSEQKKRKEKQISQFYDVRTHYMLCRFDIV